MKTKEYTPDDLQINKDRREILAVINTATVDRDNEIVLPNGLETSGINYAGRSVLVAHNKELLPVGSILWVKPQGNKQVLCKFRISDKTQDANDVYGLITDGCLNFVSVGFLVKQESSPTPQELKDNPDWAGAMNIVRSWELIELSLCAVPANPEAQIIDKQLDCWSYETKVGDLPVDLATCDIGPVETPNGVVACVGVKDGWKQWEAIPSPRYSRKYDLDRHIKQILSRHDAKEIIERIKGRA